MDVTPFDEFFVEGVRVQFQCAQGWNGALIGQELVDKPGQRFMYFDDGDLNICDAGWARDLYPSKLKLCTDRGGLIDDVPQDSMAVDFTIYQQTPIGGRLSAQFQPLRSLAQS